jgi:Uma2 family endonuclease
MTVIAAVKKQTTADELLAMGDIGRCELIDGEIIHMAPAGAQHGGVTMEIAARIQIFVSAKKLGKVYAAETGFTIKRSPDSVRAPDVAFIQSSHLPDPTHAGFIAGAPDLAVEVCSPSDRWSEVLAKIDQWLAAGATSVWVVDPPSKSIEVYRKGSQSIRYHVGQKITDEPTLPGFELSVEDIFK